MEVLGTIKEGWIFRRKLWNIMAGRYFLVRSFFSAYALPEVTGRVAQTHTLLLDDYHRLRKTDPQYKILPKCGKRVVEIRH